MIAEYPIGRGTVRTIVPLRPHWRADDWRADLERRRERLRRYQLASAATFRYVEVPAIQMPQRAIVAAETTLAWARADLGLRCRPGIVFVEAEADLTRVALASLERRGARVHGHPRQVMGWIAEQGVMYVLARGTIGQLRALILHESWHFLEAESGAFEVAGGHDPRAEAYARRLVPAPFDAMSYEPNYG